VALDLRPLDFGDKIGATFKVYQSNFTILITIVAIVVIPLQILAALVGWLFANDLPIDPDTGLIDAEAIEASMIVGFLGTAILLAIITAIGTLLATAGVMKAIADHALGAAPDWQDSLRFAWSKIGPLVVGSIFYGLGLAGVMVAAVIALIVLVAMLDAFGAFVGVIVLIGAVVFVVVLAVSWSVWVPAVLLENKSGAKALGRSNDLTKGRRWPTLGFLVVIYIIVGLINASVGGMLSRLFSDPLAQTVINIALTVFTTPIAAAAIVVLYFDHRVRSEPFDIEHLANELGGDPGRDFGQFGTLPPDEPPPPQ